MVAILLFMMGEITDYVITNVSNYFDGKINDAEERSKNYYSPNHLVKI